MSGGQTRHHREPLSTPKPFIGTPVCYVASPSHPSETMKSSPDQILALCGQTNSARASCAQLLAHLWHVNATSKASAMSCKSAGPSACAQSTPDQPLLRCELTTGHEHGGPGHPQQIPRQSGQKQTCFTATTLNVMLIPFPKRAPLVTAICTPWKHIWQITC